MNIWLVNPFDPLPGDPEQEGRYATLARLLCQKGHRVIWWTSTFSHRFKRPVDTAALLQACSPIGIEPRFLPSPAYASNVSLRRLWNHHVLVRRFTAASACESESPDVVLASSPPPGLARAAVQIAHARGCRAIVDIQDLWPETFHRLAPRWARPAAIGLLSPMQRIARDAYRQTDALVGVADAYVQRGVDLGGDKSVKASFPLGVDLAAFDAAAAAGRCERYTKPAEQTWLVYSGSLNRSYDCLTIVRAMTRIGERFGDRVRLFVTGRGELSRQAEEIVQREKLKNTTLTGFMEFNEWAYLLSQCDVGFNASFPEAMIFLPNKIFYYLAAGLAVLNTIPGECSRIVCNGSCGYDYTAGNSNSCAEMITKIVQNADGCRSMRRAARHLAETVYDRKVLYPKYVDLIERMGQS